MVRSTVLQHFNGLKRFFHFLAETAATVDGPEHLRPEHIDGFESWLEAQRVTTIHRHTIIAKVIIALRTIDASRPGVLDDKLRQRLRYTSARPAGRSTPRDALQRLRRQAAARRCSCGCPGRHTAAESANPDRASRRHAARPPGNSRRGHGVR